MTKITSFLAAVSVAAISSTVSADAPNFSGATLGLNVGYSMGNVKTSFSNQSGAAVFSNTNVDATSNNGISGVAGGLTVGYGKMFNAMYLGLEASAGLSGAKNTSYLSTKATVQSKQKDSLGLALKAGTVFGGTLAFIKLGVLSSKFNNQVSTPTGTLTVAQNKRLTAFAPAVGFETMIAKNWVLGGEYTYAKYNKNSVNYNVAGETLTTTFKPQISTAALTLKYKF